MRRMLMRIFSILLLIATTQTAVLAQKFSSEKGSITFFSDAAIEDIEAVNTMVGSLFNSTTGELVYIVKIKDFKFQKTLMREHFNEKYMETEKFPKSTFTGKVSGFKPNVPGEQKVKAAGKLEIHGITKVVDIPGTMELTNGKLVAKSKFIVKLQDYNIKIPKLVWQNIAEEIEVRIDFTYKAL
jgi:hypothetical protein